MKYRIVSALFAASLLFIPASALLAWEGITSGTEKLSRASAGAVKFDALGNIVVAGSLDGQVAFTTNFTVLKLTGAGNEIWRVSIPLGSAKTVAVHSAGFIAAAGSLGGYDGIHSIPSALTVIKFDESGNELWRRTISGTNQAGGAQAVSFDSAGNIIAAGTVANTGMGNDLFVVKFDPNGNELWRYVLNGQANNNDRANALSVDSDGNVIVAGTTTKKVIPTPSDCETCFTKYDTDFAVIKLNGATGAEIWRRFIDGGLQSNFGTDSADAVALDSLGNAFVTGIIMTNSGRQTLVKFDGATGAELWRGAVNSDGSNALVLDTSGNPVVAGSTSSAPRKMVLTKYDAGTGALIWRGLYQSANSAVALSAAVDAAGNVYAAGQAVGGGNTDFVVVKADGATGTELWRQSIAGNDAAADNTFGNAAIAITVDSSGNPVAVGLANASDAIADGLASFTVQKLNGASGAVIWQIAVLSRIATDNRAFALSFDAAGDVFAAGYLSNKGGRRDFSVVKFSRGNGTVIWKKSIGGRTSSNDEAFAIALDASGNPVAAGHLQNTSDDFFVAKFNGASGEILWRQQLARGIAAAIAMNADGDVFVAGESWGMGSSVDTNFNIVKLRGTDGLLLWSQSFEQGSANALALDSAGDVFVAGFVSFFPVLFKFHGATSTEIWRLMLGGGDKPAFVAVDSSNNVVVGNPITKVKGATGDIFWRREGFFDKIAVDSSGNIAAAAKVFRPKASTLSLVDTKYDGDTGDELWRQSVTRGHADVDRDIDFDADGNVFSTGGVFNENQVLEVVVLKRNSGNGAEVWRQVLKDQDPFGPQVLALDTAGNVAVAGSINNSEIGEAFAVVTLNGDDGSDFAGGALPPTVDPPPTEPRTLVVGSTELPYGEIAIRYRGNLQISGGVPPYNLSIIGGALPSGLTIDATGVINGTPVTATKKNPQSFTVQVLDSNNHSITRQFSIGVYSAPVNTTTSLKPAVMKKRYNATLKATGGKAPYLWSLVGGSLPVGFFVGPLGNISGNPVAPGTYNLTLRATDALGGFQDKTLPLVIK